jgi:hypothetical protein
MRAPSQLRLETAEAYAVRGRFTIGAHTYLPGEFVDGDTARAWPTFRSLLGVHWLIPATAPAPDLPPVPKPRQDPEMDNFTYAPRRKRQGSN